MEPYIDTIIIYASEERAAVLCRNNHHNSFCGQLSVDMKFKDGIAIEVDKDGDIPLFDDPIILVYPTIATYKSNDQMQQEVEDYVGPERATDPIPFDIALKYGIPYTLSELIEIKHENHS